MISYNTTLFIEFTTMNHRLAKDNCDRHKPIQNGGYGCIGVAHILIKTILIKDIENTFCLLIQLLKICLLTENKT